MNLGTAQRLAEKVVAALEPFCLKVAVAGSVRRQKEDVHDLDIVAIPKIIVQPGQLGGFVRFTEPEVWKTILPRELKKLELRLDLSGQELHRFTFLNSGFQVDLYRARLNTWGVILLVRTGSKEHNIRLCSIARSKGLKLSASEGVVAQEGLGQVIASETEEEIFAALGLLFVEPREREVRAW